MNQMQKSEKVCVSSGAWKILGSALVVAAIAGILLALPDLKRYIKISNM